jgi:PAS domain S-box-containing protein
MIEAFDGLIYICSADFRVEFMNQRLIERTGRAAIGEPCYEVLHKRSSVCPWCVNDRVQRGETVRWEVLSPLDHRWYYVVNTPIRHADGRISKQALILDIHDRKLAEEGLRRNELKYRSLFENAPVAILAIDLESGRILDANPLAVELAGWPREALVGMPHQMLHPPDHRAMVEEWLQTCLTPGRPRSQEVPLQHRNGQTIPVELICGGTVEIGGQRLVFRILRDLREKYRLEHERRQWEERVNQARRLESLGVLAGGIAHDFNNLLMVVMGHLELMGRSLDPDSPARWNLVEVEKAARRAGTLCQQMLAFSGHRAMARQRLSLNDFLRSLASALEPSFPRQAPVELRLQDPLPEIDADPGSLRQVVLNLVDNAREAMTNRSGPVTVATSRCECDRALLSGLTLGESLPPGPYVCLEVVDTGCGMAEEIRRRLFEPFFSTKFPGRGLGLAAVLGIVRAHNGAIGVDSTPDRGSRFRLFFPLAAPMAPSPEEPLPPLASSAAQAGTILLVDDQESVRSVGQAMLEELGYAVITADSGLAALDLLETLGAKVRGVLLDLTMPRLDGMETQRRIRQRWPDLPVILMSGFSHSDLERAQTIPGVIGFLQKPFQMRALADILARLPAPASLR